MSKDCNCAEKYKDEVWAKRTRYSKEENDAYGIRDPNENGKDKYSWPIEYSQYGKQSRTGWEVDHIVAKANGGKCDLGNLQPLYWKNNRVKGDKKEGDFEPYRQFGGGNFEVLK